MRLPRGGAAIQTTSRAPAGTGQFSGPGRHRGTRAIRGGRPRNARRYYARHPDHRPFDAGWDFAVAQDRLEAILAEREPDPYRPGSTRLKVDPRAHRSIREVMAALVADQHKRGMAALIRGIESTVRADGTVKRWGMDRLKCYRGWSPKTISRRLHDFATWGLFEIRFGSGRLAGDPEKGRATMIQLHRSLRPAGAESIPDPADSVEPPRLRTASKVGPDPARAPEDELSPERRAEALRWVAEGLHHALPDQVLKDPAVAEAILARAGP